MARERDLGESSLLLKYRAFVLRYLGQPVCAVNGRADPAETAARRHLVDDVNHQIASSGVTDISPIVEDDIRSRENGRKVLQEQHDYVADAEMHGRFMKFAQDRILAKDNPEQVSLLVDNYLFEWRTWEPGTSKEFDFRNADEKFGMLETLCGVSGPICKQIMPELVSHLSRQTRLKAENPDIWLSYALRVIEKMPQEPWVQGLLNQSSNSTIRLLSKVR
jgi:hypothetical protein